jgi:hypothetical protein
MLFSMHIFGWFLLVPGIVAVIVLVRWMDSIESLLTQIHDSQIEANFKTREEMRDIQRMIETIAVQIRERGP